MCVGGEWSAHREEKFHGKAAEWINGALTAAGRQDISRIRRWDKQKFPSMGKLPSTAPGKQYYLLSISFGETTQPGSSAIPDATVLS